MGLLRVPARVLMHEGSQSPKAPVVVLLHGFMGTPEDLAPFARSLGVDARFLFPEAPLDLAPLGLRGRGWWPKIPPNAGPDRSRDPSHVVPDGFGVARTHLDELIEDLEPMIGERPFVLGGFSQGAMLACDFALRTSRAIDGLVFFSVAPVAQREWRSRYAARSGLRALISHGRLDADLSFDVSARFQGELQAAGWDVTWLPFDGGHEVPLVIWRALKKWLRR
jgi:phospholipase/carboxylesterase